MVSRARPRILVADDDAAVRRALRQSLRRHFDVEEACDGAQVVARIEAGEKFDAILMDLEMPILNGRQALERLGVIAPELAERTLILTGGASTPELRRWLGDLAPGRVYKKPVAPSVLVAAINGLLESR